MSAIGDYIHLYGWNYADYGTNKMRSGKSKSSVSAAAALNSARASVRQRITALGTNEDTKQIETDLNKLLDWLGTKDPKGEMNVSVARNILGQIISESWNDAMSNRNINFSSANVTSAGGIGTIKSRGHYAGRSIGYEGTLRNRITALNQTLKELEEKIASAGTEEEVLMLGTDIIRIKKLVEDNFTLVNQYLQETNLAGTKRRSANEMNMIKELNDMIKTYVPFLDDANQKGHLFEDIIALIPQKIQTLAATELDNAIRSAIKSGVKGGLTDKMTYNPDAFMKGMIEKGKVGAEYIENYNAFIKSVKESSQKIDVTIEYNGKDVDISAKNLNLGKKWNKMSKAITLTNGNPLLSLLQDESSDFVNHYLNLFADHGYTEGAYGNMFSSMRNQYLDVIKLMIIYKALTGDVYGRESGKAEVFIVNNNAVQKGKHVRVVNIKAVLRKIANSRYDFMQVEPKNVFSESHRYTNTKIGEDDDPWARTGTARIARLLSEVHAVKVHAMIPAKTIMNLTTMEH